MFPSSKAVVLASLLDSTQVRLVRGWKRKEAFGCIPLLWILERSAAVFEQEILQKADESTSERLELRLVDTLESLEY